MAPACSVLRLTSRFGLLRSEQVLEAQMKADMADKEMLESSQSKYEEEVREKCSIISEQKAVRSQQIGDGAI